MRQIKCSKCGYVGNEDEFPTGRDFFQNSYIASCPNPGCDNRQNPGDASMRMFGSERPFSFVQRDAPNDDALSTVLHRADEAS